MHSCMWLQNMQIIAYIATSMLIWCAKVIPCFITVKDLATYPHSPSTACSLSSYIRMQLAIYIKQVKLTIASYLKIKLLQMVNFNFRG